MFHNHLPVLQDIPKEIQQSLDLVKNVLENIRKIIQIKIKTIKNMQIKIEIY